MTAAMQEDFEQADDAGVVDLEPLRLEAGKAIGDGLETLADGIEMVQSLFEPEVGEVVGDQLVAQEGGELFVLLQKRVFEVGAEDVMAVLNAIDDGGQLAAHPAVQTGAEDLGDLVARQPPQAELAAAFEEFMDRKVALEDEVAAILDLGDRIKAREIELLA